MNFQELNAALVGKAEELTALLLPGGKREGREWIAGSTQGEAGRSLKVVLEGAKAGMWKDFASDEGGDLVQLIKTTKGLDAKGAADFARSFLGLPAWRPDPDAPKPFDPLAMRWKGQAGTAAWAYRDADGKAFAYAVRFEQDGKKDVIPMRPDEGGKWRWKGFAAPQKPPIYGLDRLAKRPDAPVLIVEGEKTADAAAKLFPGHVCIAWLGGCKAVRKVDWAPVLRRTVTLWPDADAPGRKAMAYLHQLIPGAVMVDTAELPDAWDVADTPPPEMDLQGLLDGAKAAAEVRQKKREAKQKDQDEEAAEEQYRLPRGCQLSEVESDLLKYKVMEYGSRVYGLRNKWATEVSNCTVEIHRHVPTKDGAVALVTIRNEVGEALTMDVPFDVFSTPLSFIKWLGNQGNFQWYGSDGDFIGYKRRLMDRMRKCKLVTELGGQPNGIFMFNDAAVNSSVHRFDADGCVEVHGQWYYVPSGSSFYADDPGAYSVQKLMVLSEKGPDFAAWNGQMVRVFREHAYLATAFTLATAFSGHIFRLVQGFPVMFYYGPGGSGKDQLIKACQSVFGIPQPEIFLTGPNTDKGLIKMFAEFSDIILNLAEYRKGMKKDMDELLKSLWGRIGYRMAAMRGKKTETIPINCTAMVSGNDMPTDNALMRRLMVEVIEKREHTEADIEAFRTLREWQRAGYSNIMPEFYRHRADFVANWYDDHFKQARPVLLEATHGLNVDSSILQNMEVLYSVAHFFHSKGLGLAFHLDDLAAHMGKAMARQLEIRDDGSEVSNFFTCFVWAVKNGRLVEDRDYRISGQELSFYWGDVFPLYSEAHQRVFGERGERNGDMRMKLQRHECFSEAPKSLRIGDRNSSALTINMAKSGTNLRALLQPKAAHVGAGQLEANALDDLPF